MPKTPAFTHAHTRRHPRLRLRASVCKAKRNGLRRYEYDAANRLANVTTGAGVDAPTTRYVHNALGQRLFKTEPQFAPVNSASNPADPGVMQTLLNFFSNLWGSSTTGTATTSLTPSAADQLGFQYYYDEDGSLLYEQGSGGASSTGSAHYVYLPTPAGPMPIAAYTGARHYAVHTDHLNTPRRLTQSNKTVAWQWAFSAFGDELPTTARNRFVDITNNPSLGTTTVAEVTFNLRYPGQYFDKESGLHFNWIRSYSPNNGRYSQADPIDLQGGWNKFGYAEQNPLMYTDPLGLWSVTIDGYAGLGGGMTFGRDPNTGQGFMNMRGGWGLGGGFKWEQSGGRPGSEGATPASCNSGGVGAGVFGDADFNFGPLQAGLQNSLGRNMGQPQPYGQFMSPSWSFGDSWGIKAGWSAGGQVTMWGRRK